MQDRRFDTPPRRDTERLRTKDKTVYFIAL